MEKLIEKFILTVLSISTSKFAKNFMCQQYSFGFLKSEWKRQQLLTMHAYLVRSYQLGQIQNFSQSKAESVRITEIGTATGTLKIQALNLAVLIREKVRRSYVYTVASGVGKKQSVTNQH